MKSKSLYLLTLLLAALMLTASVPLDKKPLTHDVYDAWRVIGSQGLSPDGQWLYYIDAPQKGDASMVAKNLSDGREYRHSIGFTGEGTDADNQAKAAFSWDNRYLVFMISPDSATVKAAAKDKKNKDKPTKSLGIMNLSTGEVEVVERVKSFAMPEKAGGMLAYLMEKPKADKDGKKDKKAEEEEKAEPEGEEKAAEAKAEEKKPEPVEEKKTAEEPEKSKEEKKREELLEKRNKDKKEGTELMVRPLADTVAVTLKNVTEYEFTKNGAYLVYVVSTKDTLLNDGVFVMAPGDTAGRALVSGKGDYKHLTLNKDQSVLAFMTNSGTWEAMVPTFDLYGWALGADKAELWVSHTRTAGIPEGMAVSDKSRLTFSEDGKVLMLGIKEIEEVDLEEDDAPKAKFDLWHWNDPYPQPQQKIMAKQVKDNTWECVYHVKNGKLVKLADEDLPDVTLNRTGTIAFASNEWPYTKLGSFENWYSDAWVVDVKTGRRTLVEKKIIGSGRLSPEGRYVTWFDSKDWWIYDVKSGSKVNVTEGLDVQFDREDHDTPNPAEAWGNAGWTRGDRHFLVYDKYDIWAVSPDGKKRYRMTEGYGRDHDLSFRLIRLDRDEVAYDDNAPLLLRTVNTETMASGFYRDRITGTKAPQELLMADRGYGYPRKALNADKVIFTRQAVDEYPDIWVSSLAFDDVQKVTDLGSQMAPYVWPQAELRSFKSADGWPLKGILLKPDNFDPGKQYPLMVYIYETLHEGLHRYRHPSPGSSINYSYYVSNGYIVWMPDIEYHTGYPGQDALKCVLPGIQMLVGEGYIDEDAIGIQGHSWGGYQIAYMITQTDIFAAVEAGAPVSNMTSAYGGIRWASGMVRQFQYERTQSRLGGSLWEVPMRYFENSPVFWADKVNTPIMMMHNDDDGAVPWYQGIEYIMALRRLGKEAYMFNYNGEKHGLRKRVNQEDWTIRLAEFFDHHLKGAPEPDWMKNGIKAWDKE